MPAFKVHYEETHTGETGSKIVDANTPNEAQSMVRKIMKIPIIISKTKVWKKLEKMEN